MRKNILISLLTLFLFNVQILASGIDWEVNVYDFQYDMTAYITLRLEGEDVEELSKYTIAAFCNDECRGVMEVRSVDNNEYGYLRIRSNQSKGESITFKVYDPTSDRIALSTNQIVFQSQQVMGYPSSPFVVEAEFQNWEPEFVTICNGDSFAWDKSGKTYTSSGVYTTIYNNGQATLHLTVLSEAITKAETITISSDDVPYIWRGQSYSATGLYTDVEKYAATSCDSVIYVLDLTVLATDNVEETSATICENELPYIWYDQSLTVTGKYTYSEKYVGTDIDSIQHILNLTVLPTTYTTEQATICDGETFTWHGTAYTVSGKYTVVLTSVLGCDSVVTLNLKVNPIEYAEVSVTACDSYVWNGKTYTESGDYTFITTTASGCDRIETLHLTINYTDYAEENVIVCDSYVWHDEIYTESGNYTYTTTAANGCDSVEILHLTIIKAVVESEEVALCPSELPYSWYGLSLTENGVYSVTEQYESGCDSVIHELSLNIYVQTLPEDVTFPSVHPNKPIDVTIPNAEIQAHIDAQTWYAPNAWVIWYIMENAEWVELTTEPISQNISRVLLKYAVETDCDIVESEPMMIIVEPTSLDTIHGAEVKTYKIMHNDKVWIIRNGEIYNTIGLKVTEMR